MRPPDSSVDTGESSARPDLVHEELHRRIETLRAHHEDDFGGFNALDWVLILLGWVLLPVIAYVWFLP